MPLTPEEQLRFDLIKLRTLTEHMWQRLEQGELPRVPAATNRKAQTVRLINRALAGEWIDPEEIDGFISECYELEAYRLAKWGQDHVAELRSLGLDVYMRLRALRRPLRRVRLTPAERIAEALDQRGWKPRQLAEKLGVDRTTVVRWLHGTPPSRHHCWELADVLGGLPGDYEYEGG